MKPRNSHGNRGFRGESACSTGPRWQSRTTHLRDDDPARNVIGRPLLLSRDTRITERFTRVSPTELVYRFTVEDDGLYRQPWTGEFSLTRHDVRIYEYACHEGNYSLPLSLVGGQAQAAKRAETAPNRN